VNLKVIKKAKREQVLKTNKHANTENYLILLNSVLIGQQTLFSGFFSSGDDVDIITNTLSDII
jgi:hypothetical protein